MKKRIWVKFGLVVVTLLLVVHFYKKINSVKIELNKDNLNLYAIEVRTPWTSIYTKDPDEINEVLEYVNEFVYYKEGKKKQLNQSPDARIMLYTKDGSNREVVERIYFYGDVAIYSRVSRYKAPKDLYSRIEKLGKR